MRGDEMRGDEMRGDEMRGDEMRGDGTKSQLACNFCTEEGWDDYFENVEIFQSMSPFTKYFLTGPHNDFSKEKLKKLIFTSTNPRFTYGIDTIKKYLEPHQLGFSKLLSGFAINGKYFDLAVIYNETNGSSIVIIDPNQEYNILKNSDSHAIAQIGAIGFSFDQYYSEDHRLISIADEFKGIGLAEYLYGVKVRLNGQNTYEHSSLENGALLYFFIKKGYYPYECIDRSGNKKTINKDLKMFILKNIKERSGDKKIINHIYSIKLKLDPPKALEFYRQIKK